MLPETMEVSQNEAKEYGKRIFKLAKFLEFLRLDSLAQMFYYAYGCMVKNEVETWPSLEKGNLPVVEEPVVEAAEAPKKISGWMAGTTEEELKAIIDSIKDDLAVEEKRIKRVKRNRTKSTAKSSRKVKRSRAK